MPPEVTVWTPDLLRALPDDGRRYEVIDGELLVTPSPTPLHQRALRELFKRLDPYVEQQRLGILLWSPADLSFDERSLVQPDLFVVPLAIAPSFKSWTEVTSLLLAVEVLSPSTARVDRGMKRHYYQRSGVEEYWVVDLDARLIDRWRPQDDRPEILEHELLWHPAGAPAPLRLDLVSLFCNILG